MLCSEVFLSSRVLRTFFLLPTSEDSRVWTAGLEKGAVEGVVLVSDSPRVSNMVYMVSSTVDLSLAGTKQAQEKTPKDYIETFYHHPGPSLTLCNSS